ncbi:hypothetical protein [Microbacterium sp. BH-3-3-3]|uniref:hypothetical protein n=1 Tax=Microbacterium sp. BH-3-3-3 TaxID=1906742 RepID=UPI00119D5B1F|nr:hypothetical protein [Microbacterium sp. BH-3-3-3]
MTNEHMVNWAHSRAYFDRVVEALIRRMWESKPGIQVHVIDGRGGDDGLDVYVERNGETVHVYQLKFFPEGMSGGWKTRRTQVKRSFKSVRDLDGLEDWTLVTPRNPTVQEQQTVGAMREGRAIRMHVWGQAALDDELSKFPNLLAWAQRDDALTFLRTAAHETDALAGPDDLQNRVRDIAAIADSRSIYWGVNVSVDHGVTTETFYPKRPDAPEKEPISFTIAPTFGPEHTELEQQFRRVLEFGSTNPVRLPPEVLGPFEVKGPEWVASRSESAALELGSPSLSEAAPAELRVRQRGAGYLARLPGEVTAVSRGLKGLMLHANFSGLTMEFRKPDEGTDGDADMHYDVIGMNATEARAVLQTVKYMDEGHDFEIFIRGQSIFQTEGYAPSDSDPNVRETLWSIVDDLAVLEKEFMVGFTIPTRISVEERIDVRVARLLAEGVATTSPKMASLTLTATDEPGDDGPDILDGQPRAMTTSNSNFVIEVLGQELHVGTFRSYHPAVAIRDAEALREKRARGEITGSKVILAPTDGTPLRIWLQERWKGGQSSVIVPVPWELDDIPETKGLGQIDTTKDSKHLPGETSHPIIAL